jgi:hypothetical protein
MKKIFACVLIVLLVVSVPAFARPKQREVANLGVDTIIGASISRIKPIGGTLGIIFGVANVVTYAITGKTIGGYAIDGFERSSEIIYSKDNPFRGWMSLGMQ